jgi:hypothetical protein
MSLRVVYFILVAFCAKNALSQTIESGNPENLKSSPTFLLPDSLNMASYSDSLKKALNCDLLTGKTISVFNEVANDVKFYCAINDSQQRIITPDSIGRFFIIPDSTFSSLIRISLAAANYHSFDTIIEWNNYLNSPLILKIEPRYKISIRGRAFAGSLPVEEAKVEIIHNCDTFRTQTLSCYIDNENYWNCLYLGMFKHSLVFDRPEDTVYIAVSKEGFRTSILSFRCDSYDGTVLPIKLRYSKLLPQLYQNNIHLKISPPFLKNWMVSINYEHLLKIGNSKRVGFGLEGSMLISNITTNLSTFRNISDLPDTSYYTAKFDSSYISTMLSPQVFFLVNNPQRRNFAVYSGMCFPYNFNEKKIQLQAFAGTSFYLDLNKALVIECRYISYGLDVAHYTFNAYGNATRYTLYESFNKIIINLGLKISF